MKNTVTNFRQPIIQLSLCVHRGIRDLSHLPLTRNNSAEGHTSLLPAMWNLSLTLLCSQHQDRLPGCHRQKSPASSQSQLIQAPCSGLFPRLMLCPSGWWLSSLAQWPKAWSELGRFLGVISFNKSDSEARRLANRLPLICLSYFTSFFQKYIYFFLHFVYLITRAYFCLFGTFLLSKQYLFFREMQGYYWMENDKEFCKMNHSLLYRTLFYQKNLNLL